MFVLKFASGGIGLYFLALCDTQNLNSHEGNGYLRSGGLFSAIAIRRLEWLLNHVVLVRHRLEGQRLCQSSLISGVPQGIVSFNF